jgi:hypothetical protein
MGLGGSYTGLVCFNINFDLFVKDGRIVWYDLNLSYLDFLITCLVTFGSALSDLFLHVLLVV